MEMKKLHASTKKVSICKLYIFLYSVISNLIFLQKKLLHNNFFIKNKKNKTPYKQFWN
jgi:hypothetical protein